MCVCVYIYIYIYIYIHGRISRQKIRHIQSQVREILRHVVSKWAAASRLHIMGEILPQHPHTAQILGVVERLRWRENVLGWRDIVWTLCDVCVCICAAYLEAVGAEAAAAYTAF